MFLVIEHCLVNHASSSLLLTKKDSKAITVWKKLTFLIEFELIAIFFHNLIVRYHDSVLFSIFYTYFSQCIPFRSKRIDKAFLW